MPATLADRELLRIMVFGVVLFTLLAQGTTMQLLLRRLGLIQREDAALEYERRHGRLMAARAARERVAQLYHAGMIAAQTWESLAPALDRQLAEALQAQEDWLRDHPALRLEERDDAQREGVWAERSMLTSLYNDGVLSEHVYSELVTEVDAALLAEPTEESPPPATQPAPAP